MKKTLVFTAALLLIPPQAFCLSLGDIFTEVVNQATQTDNQPKQEVPASQENSREEQSGQRESDFSESLTKKSSIRKERLLIWEDIHARMYLAGSFAERELILDTVNKYAENDIEKATTFVPPRKSEFEKQADFEVRLRKAQFDFNRSEAVADTNGFRFKTLKKYFNPMVGSPVVSGDAGYFSYDAENEVLTIIVKHSDSKSHQTDIPVSINNVSPTIAKAFKVLASPPSGLNCIGPHVAMEWSTSGRLTARYVVFDYEPQCSEKGDLAAALRGFTALPEAHPLKYGIEVNHPLPIVFGQETASNYDKNTAALGYKD